MLHIYGTTSCDALRLFLSRALRTLTDLIFMPRWFFSRGQGRSSSEPSNNSRSENKNNNEPRRSSERANVSQTHLSLPNIGHTDTSRDSTFIYQASQAADDDTTLTSSFSHTYQDQARSIFSGDSVQSSLFSAENSQRTNTSSLSESSISFPGANKRRDLRVLGSSNSTKAVLHHSSLRSLLAELADKTTPMAAPQADAARTAGLLAQLLIDYSLGAARLVESGDVLPDDKKDFTRVLRLVLHFSDNLLFGEEGAPARTHLLTAFQNFGEALGLLPNYTGSSSPRPRNWALPSDAEGITVAQALLDGIRRRAGGLSEHEGAFIAPVLRGLGENCAVTTLMLGISGGIERHMSAVTAIQGVCPNIHVFCVNDSIVPASFHAANPSASAFNSHILPPLRIPRDPLQPPISLSLSVDSSQKISGTLGGYLYPIIPADNHLFHANKDDTFALTCGHVCPGEGARNAIVPSAVLMSLFCRKLAEESAKHAPRSVERATYQNALDQAQSIKLENLGRIVWAERTLVGDEISDIAIIRCNSQFKCRNFVGDDINLTQYDPALMFKNLHVRSTAVKVEPGRHVFKYGSTTKYTQGTISAMRMIYWSSGKLYTSEFAVAGEFPFFAAGGDSGAWILSKGLYGLEVIGMLHSHDGDRKELGLFTPISSILRRLKQITSVEWGVVGVPNSADVLDESD